jgi:hypothetical protein
MQTFLPSHDFEQSAEFLDNKRLGKQRVENLQILKAIRGIYSGERIGWKNHPATRMWVNHLPYFADYHSSIVGVWEDKGFEDTTFDSFREVYYDIRERYPEAFANVQYPWFLGWEPFHASHRSNLIRKDPVHYGQFGWKEPNDLPYIWPSKLEPQIFKHNG